MSPPWGCDTNTTPSLRHSSGRDARLRGEVSHAGWRPRR
ncbi:Hypothetical protein A7982_07982 [Minicystis rosea]|nr:Hypothetical protein A7982_07982 [Minicystis rosea]